MSRGVSRKAKIKVGIVGFGGQGQLHFESLWTVPPFEVAWVFDQNTRRTSSLPSALRIRSFEDALRQEVQVVVVATPSSSHFSIAQALLLAERNILIEKPITVSDGETRQLLELAQRKKLFVLTHFNRRWDPDFLTVKQMLSKYDFGQIHEIESRVTDAYALSESYPRRKRWKFQYPGGGILLDWAPHLPDQLFELMGRRQPRYLYCYSDRPNRIVDSRLEEQFIIQVKYSNCLATLGASWNIGLPRPRWLVYGTRAALQIDKVGESRGILRRRRGGQILTQQIEEHHTLSAPDALRSLVQRSVQHGQPPSEEVRRIRIVSYGIDLARCSHSRRQPLTWELRQRVGS